MCVCVLSPRSREQPSCQSRPSLLSAAGHPTQYHHHFLCRERGGGKLHPQSAYHSQNRPESHPLKSAGGSDLASKKSCRISCVLSFKGIFRINSDLEDSSALQRLAFIFIVIMEMSSFILSYIRKKGVMQLINLSAWEMLWCFSPIFWYQLTCL